MYSWQGLGLEYAHQLRNAGSRCIVISSRAGILPSTTLREFGQAGIVVFVIKTNSGNPNSVSAMMAWIHEHLPYPEHYVHAAGKSSFTMLEDLHDSGLWDVAQPKVSSTFGLYLSHSTFLDCTRISPYASCRQFFQLYILGQDLHMHVLDPVYSSVVLHSRIMHHNRRVYHNTLL